MSNFTLKNNSTKSSIKNEFESFFRYCYDDLCNFAFSYVSDREVARDIVQSIFLKVWERRDVWNNFEKGKAYMLKAVRNEAINYKNHQETKRKSEDEIQHRMREWNEGQNSERIESKKLEIIREGIRKLPEKRREIFKLSRENGLTYREIADFLGISIKTVETQMGRSLKSLRSFVIKHFNLSALLLTVFGWLTGISFS